MPGELLEWASDSEPALAKSHRSRHSGFVMQLLFPSLLRAATRFSGTAFGLRPALAKSRRNGKPTRRRSEGHGEPVRKYLISQFGPFLSYTEGRFFPAMLIFGQAGVGLNWTGDGLEPGWTRLGLEWTGMGNETGLD